MRILLLLLFLLPIPRKAAGDIQVVSIVGHAAVGESAMRKDAILEANEILNIAKGSIVQLLVDNRVALSLCGPAKVKIERDPIQLMFLEGEKFRVAGTGVAMLKRGWRIELGSDGASVLLFGQTLYVLFGKATVHLEPRSRDSKTASEKNYEIVAGQIGVVGEEGQMVVKQGRPEPWILKQTLIYEPPAIWFPQVGQVTLSQVDRAEKWTQEQLKTDREMVSCGCTETSDSSGGPVSGQGPSIDPLEKRNTTIRVRINGMPPKIAR
ncbi:MAG: hypothetical protein V1754_02445 [Pseudomonadota bacterium]